MNSRILACFALAWLFGAVLPPDCLALRLLKIADSDLGVFDPEQGPMKLTFQLLEDAKEVAFLVEDFTGSVVQDFIKVDLPPGSHELIWEGFGQDGHPFPDGSYRINLRATFRNGVNEQKAANVRIARLSVAVAGIRPELPAPREEGNRLDGAAAVIYRHDDEATAHRHNGEYRFRNHIELASDNWRADGVVAVRRPFHEEASYDGCQASFEQNWQSGRLQGIYRRSLGTLDDPLRLFSDFRTERKKLGARVEHKAKGAQICVLGFGAEPEAASNARGVAGRAAYNVRDWLRVGLTGTALRAGEPLDDQENDSAALAGDIRVPFLANWAIAAELSGTKSDVQQNGYGYLVKTAYAQTGIKGELGYIDLDRSFAAAFADPLRQVYTDAHGIFLNTDLSIAGSMGPFRRPSFSARLFALEKDSSGEPMREADVALRIGLMEKTTLNVNWLGQKRDGRTTRNLQITSQYVWNAQLTSGLQAAWTSTGEISTRRLTVDSAFSKEGWHARSALEFIQRDNGNAFDSPSNEFSLYLDLAKTGWRLEGLCRISRSNGDDGINVFGRIERSVEFFHRYRVDTYLALGNRAAIETAKQIEAGLEISY